MRCPPEEDTCSCSRAQQDSSKQPEPDKNYYREYLKKNNYIADILPRLQSPQPGIIIYTVTKRVGKTPCMKKGLCCSRSCILASYAASYAENQAPRPTAAQSHQIYPAYNCPPVPATICPLLFISGSRRLSRKPQLYLWNRYLQHGCLH